MGFTAAVPVNSLSFLFVGVKYLCLQIVYVNNGMFVIDNDEHFFLNCECFQIIIY